MILADTSAWVEFDRATGSSVDQRITHLISTSAPLAVTEPVIMEVTAGARNADRERDLRRLLDRFELLPFEPTIDFEGATKIYRTCRKSGITPRGLIDCMIVAVAARTGAALLAQDADFARIQTVVAFDLDQSKSPT